MSKEYVLQNIIFPNKMNCSELSMYLRADQSAQLIDDRLLMSKNAECEFSTYFNAFSLNKWREYTILDNLHLCLKLKGNFRVEIYTSSWFKKNVIRNCVCSTICDCKEMEKLSFSIPVDKDESVYFSLTSLSSDGVFAGGYYGTEVADESALRSVEIDLVMCTFKREAFIKRNIQLLKESFFESKNYNASGHYHIKVVDNGQTLLADEIETQDGSIKLYPNLNVGGSGGFARGMMESLKENKATHVLFMDDDVLIQMEALERTYNLLRVLKDEYKDAFLGGAMLRLDMQHIQHENLASFMGNCLVSYKNNLDLNLYKNVLFNEKYEHVSNTYGAWWYCCMPRQMIGLDNLPYPFFIRMDDMEYSLRSPKKWISLNGISVWHEAFDKKYSTMMENYFMFRNFLVVSAVHKDYSLKWHLAYMTRRFIREIIRFDYSGAELLLDGAERFLQGPGFFQTVDTVEDLKEHASKQAKVKPLSELDWDGKLYNFFKYELRKVRESRLKKLFRFATLNGHLLPSFFLKNAGYAEYGYTSKSQHYFRCKKVLGCDLNFDNGTVLEMSRGRCFSLLMRYIKVSLKFTCNYARLKKEYRDSYAYMTSVEFWEKYLKLK